MNHIHRLQHDNAALNTVICDALVEISAFRALLAGPKFTGVDQDGTRKDWIATADVLRRLETLRDLLTGIESSAAPRR